MIHMGKQLVHQLHDRQMTSVEFAKRVTKFLPFLKGKKLRGKKKVCSKQWVYEICQTTMWQPKTLLAVSSALEVKPEIFLQPVPTSGLNGKSPAKGKH